MSIPSIGSGSSQIGQDKHDSPQALRPDTSAQRSKMVDPQGKKPRNKKVGSSKQGSTGKHENCAATNPGDSATNSATTKLLIAILLSWPEIGTACIKKEENGAAFACLFGCAFRYALVLHPRRLSPNRHLPKAFHSAIKRRIVPLRCFFKDGKMRTWPWCFTRIRHPCKQNSRFLPRGAWCLAHPLLFFPLPLRFFRLFLPALEDQKEENPRLPLSSSFVIFLCHLPLSSSSVARTRSGASRASVWSAGLMGPASLLSRCWYPFIRTYIVASGRALHNTLLSLVYRTRGCAGHYLCPSIFVRG